MCKGCKKHSGSNIKNQRGCPPGYNAIVYLYVFRCLCGMRTGTYVLCYIPCVISPDSVLTDIEQEGKVSLLPDPISNRLSLKDFLLYAIPHMLFIRAPERRDEQFLITVSGEPVYDDIIGNDTGALF